MIIKIIKIFILVFLVVILALSSWFALEYSSSPKMESKEILFEVNKGKGAEAIARDLKKEGVLKKTQPFILGYKFFFSKKSLKAGEYVLTLPLSARDILKTLVEGKIFLHPITIPEGLTGKEIIELLSVEGFGSEESFLKYFSRTELLSSIDTDATNLEGYLFPETYHFPKGTSPEKVITTMVSQFKEIFSPELQKRAKEIGFTTREVIILASLVEKETSVPEERILVSSVFHNRLKRRIKLDCDPTIIYALKQEGRYKDRLRTRDLKYDTPYNTYLYRGLPPGPICNPGKESLRAALYPADEDYLYFVSKNDGSHKFSRTLREHNQAVDMYQRKRK